MTKPHTIHVFINRQQFELEDPVQTGRALKELAGIPLGDVLFLQHHGDDQVVPNDATITLKNGDHLHSSPPADYGTIGHEASPSDSPSNLPTHLPQPDGWTFVLFQSFQVPAPYEPQRVTVLVKLPPGFPVAAPDMFWATPAVRLHNGTAPTGTSPETVLGQQWQRFSWHLAPGAWRPGVSDLRDFVRCVRARFQRPN